MSERKINFIEILDSLESTIQCPYALWLQKNTIEKYNKEDWTELSDEKQKRLEMLVSKLQSFLKEEYNKGQTPPTSVSEKALPIFNEIIEIVKISEQVEKL